MKIKTILFTLLASISFYAMAMEPGFALSPVGLSAGTPGANANNDQALWEAALQGNEHEMRRLIELGANINTASAQGVTPLMLAAFNGHLKIAQILLEHNAEVNIQAAGENNTFALKGAAEKGHAKIVQLLLNAGADITMANAHGVTPLIVAAQENHIEVVKILLEHGADANAYSLVRDTFALLSAARKGHKKIVQLLVDKGAELDKVDAKGMTPLILAAYQGHLDVVQTLLKYGANANAQATNFYNISALALAAQNGHIEVVKALLTTISNADAQPMQDSCFALHRAMGQLSMKVPKDVRKLLADHLVDTLVQKRMKEIVWPMVQLQDSRGQSAWKIALNENQQEIAHLLDLMRSETTMRRLVKADVWLALKSQPISKYPAAQAITWSEAFGAFESKEEQDEN